MASAASNRRSHSRREFLRGVGASIALPTLASFPATGVLAAAQGPLRKLATTATGVPLRTAFVFFPNGVVQDTWWPKDPGAGFELSRSLAPLAENREHIQVLGGLDQANAEPGSDGAGDHARGGGVFLTGVRLKKSATKFRAGVSIDQELARRVGNQTRFDSLEMSCEPARTTGNCDSGYSCAYTYNLSWSSPTTPKTAESNPRLLFERMFGSGSPQERVRNLQQRRDQQRSILDFVLEDTRAVNKQLDSFDRAKLDEYFTVLRDLERRIDKADSLGVPGIGDTETPGNVPSSYPEYISIMFDMLLLAFQTDSTRVASLMLSRDGSNRSFDHIGVSEGHHDLSHHRNDEEKIQKLAEIDLWYVQQFNSFLTKLRELKDFDGSSLLDNSMIVFGSGNSDGNRHTHRNLPVILAGGGGGSLTTNRYVQHGSVPMCNMYLALAQRMGITDLHEFGDSNAVLGDL